MSSMLEARNVCMYFGGLKAVEKVDLDVEKGDIYGVIGPNGAGKTTFFNICSGIYKPTSGEIKFNGENIVGLKPEQIAFKGLARTFQNIKLFNYMSVLDNIKIGFHSKTKTNLFDAIVRNQTYKRDEEAIAQKGEEILEMVGLTEYRDTKAGNLAYGIQRRVEIARSLALDPQMLMLDEPAAGMNPNETVELMEFIKELSRLGYTIVVIEHDMKFVMNTCSQILVLNFGRKICSGTPEHVIGDMAVHEAYFGKGTVAGEAVKANA